MKKVDYDVLIVGSGPAGLSAAIYIGRADLKAAILEKDAPGGKLIKTDIIENYPGYKSINGTDLAMKMIEQAESFGVEIIYSGLDSFEKQDDIFVCKLDDQKILTSKALIIANGQSENKIKCKNEDKFYSKGVSYCAVCDGANFKNQVIAVVGGGYSALEEAIFLTRFATKIYLIHRRQEFRADNHLSEKVRKHPKITMILDSIVISINGDSNVTNIDIKNLKTDEVTNLKVAAVFPFIGHVPQTHFIKDKDMLDENGNIVVDDYMKTKIPGLFSAGDVRKTVFRQIVTAASDGSIAGQMAVKYIENWGK